MHACYSQRNTTFILLLFSVNEKGCIRSKEWSCTEILSINLTCIWRKLKLNLKFTRKQLRSLRKHFKIQIKKETGRSRPYMLAAVSKPLFFLSSDSSIPSHPSRSEVDSPEFRVMKDPFYCVRLNIIIPKYCIGYQKMAVCLFNIFLLEIQDTTTLRYITI